jgi:hypothetical protein
MPSHDKLSFFFLLILKELKKVYTLRTKPFPPLLPGFGTLWYGLCFGCLQVIPKLCAESCLI